MRRQKLYVLIVVFLTFLTWHKVLGQIFMGEGYFYFQHSFGKWQNFGEVLASLLRFDTLAKILFDILPKFFADNIQLYMAWMLTVVILVNILYYFLVYALTEKKIVALAASVFFIVNDVALKEMLAIGNYQFFAQRIVNFLLIFPSFFLLVQFVKKKTGKLAYLSSVVLYLTAVLAGQFSIFFLPMLVFYPFVFWLVKKENGKDFLAKIFLVLPFVLGTFTLLELDKSSFVSDKSFFQYIFHSPSLLTDVAYQLPWTIFPLPILRWLSEPHLREPMIVFSIPAAAIYLITCFYLYRRKSDLLAPALTAAFFIPTVLFLNVYTRPSQVYLFYDGSRYLYVPSIASSIFLAIFGYSFFGPAPERCGAGKKGLIKKLLLLGFMGWWIFFNLNLIWTEMNEGRREHIAGKKTLSYVKEKSYQYPGETLVVLPKVIGYHGSGFCKKFYGKDSMQFAPMFADWEKEVDKDFDLANLIVLDYDYNQMAVVERTEEFRRLFEAGEPIGEAVKSRYK